MIHPALRIPDPHLDALNRATSRLTAKPDRSSYEFLTFLRCVEAVMGNDALAIEIGQLESDLGLTESECLSCGHDCYGRCVLTHDDRSTWGMDAFSDGNGRFSVAA